MKLWISGEISHEVGDAFRRAMLTVGKEINLASDGRAYDLPLDGWDCMAIIRDDGHFAERTRYSRANRDMDFRLGVDFEAFRTATSHGREALLYRMLLRSLAILRMKRLPAEPLDQLEADVRAVGRRCGWEQPRQPSS